MHGTIVLPSYLVNTTSKKSTFYYLEYQYILYFEVLTRKHAVSNVSLLNYKSIADTLIFPNYHLSALFVVAKMFVGEKQ